MEIFEIKRQIQESIDRQIEELRSIRSQPPQSFFAYRFQVSDALSRAGAPQPLVESILQGHRFDMLWSNWSDVSVELHTTDATQSRRVWREIKRHYVQDVAGTILKEFSLSHLANPLEED